MKKIAIGALSAVLLAGVPAAYADDTGTTTGSNYQSETTANGELTSDAIVGTVGLLALGGVIWAASNSGTSGTSGTTGTSGTSGTSGTN